jgi:hypothetical protein
MSSPISFDIASFPISPFFPTPTIVPKSFIEQVVPQNQRREITSEEIERLKDTLQIDGYFEYMAELMDISGKKVPLGFQFSLPYFLTRCMQKLAEANFTIYYPYENGGMAGYVLCQGNPKGSDLDIGLHIGQRDGYEYALIIILSCLEECAGINSYECNGLRTYLQNGTNFSLTVPAGKSDGFATSLFFHGGLEELYLPTPDAIDRYLLLTIPCSVNGSKCNVDFSLTAYHEYSCASSANCFQIDIGPLLYFPELAESQKFPIWARTVDEYDFKRAEELLQQNQFEITPISSCSKIRLGLANYCSHITKGLLPTSIEIERGFREGFFKQQQETAFAKLYVQLKNKLKRHYPDSPLKKVVFLMNFEEILMQDGTMPQNENILVIISSLIVDSLDPDFRKTHFNLSSNKIVFFFHMIKLHLFLMGLSEQKYCEFYHGNSSSSFRNRFLLPHQKNSNNPSPPYLITAFPSTSLLTLLSPLKEDIEKESDLFLPLYFKFLKIAPIEKFNEIKEWHEVVPQQLQVLNTFSPLLNSKSLREDDLLVDWKLKSLASEGLDHQDFITSFLQAISNLKEKKEQSDLVKKTIDILDLKKDGISFSQLLHSIQTSQKRYHASLLKDLENAEDLRWLVAALSVIEKNFVKATLHDPLLEKDLVEFLQSEKIKKQPALHEPAWALLTMLTEQNIFANNLTAKMLCFFNVFPRLLLASENKALIEILTLEAITIFDSKDLSFLERQSDTNEILESYKKIVSHLTLHHLPSAFRFLQPLINYEKTNHTLFFSREYHFGFLKDLTAPSFVKDPENDNYSKWQNLFLEASENAMLQPSHIQELLSLWLSQTYTQNSKKAVVTSATRIEEAFAFGQRICQKDPHAFIQICTVFTWHTQIFAAPSFPIKSSEKIWVTLKEMRDEIQELPTESTAIFENLVLELFEKLAIRGTRESCQFCEKILEDAKELPFINLENTQWASSYASFIIGCAEFGTEKPIVLHANHVEKFLEMPPTKICTFITAALQLTTSSKKRVLSEIEAQVFSQFLIHFETLGHTNPKELKGQILKEVSDKLIHLQSPIVLSSFNQFYANLLANKSFRPLYIASQLNNLLKATSSYIHSSNVIEEKENLALLSLKNFNSWLSSIPQGGYISLPQEEKEFKQAIKEVYKSLHPFLIEGMNIKNQEKLPPWSFKDFAPALRSTIDNPILKQAWDHKKLNSTFDSIWLRSFPLWDFKDLDESALFLQWAYDQSIFSADQLSDCFLLWADKAWQMLFTLDDIESILQRSSLIHDQNERFQEKIKALLSNSRLKNKETISLSLSSIIQRDILLLAEVGKRLYASNSKVIPKEIDLSCKLLISQIQNQYLITEHVPYVFIGVIKSFLSCPSKRPLIPTIYEILIKQGKLSIDLQTSMFFGMSRCYLETIKITFDKELIHDLHQLLQVGFQKGVFREPSGKMLGSEIIAQALDSSLDAFTKDASNLAPIVRNDRIFDPVDEVLNTFEMLTFFCKFLGNNSLEVASQVNAISKPVNVLSREVLFPEETGLQSSKASTSKLEIRIDIDRGINTIYTLLEKTCTVVFRKKGEPHIHRLKELYRSFNLLKMIQMDVDQYFNDIDTFLEFIEKE